MDLEISNDPEIIFHWNWTGTRWQSRQWPGGVYVVNRDCLRSDKTYIDEVFERVYGYSSRAEGVWAVEKNDSTNGFKDCRMVNVLQQRKGYFYQRPLMDCTVPEWEFKEYRITVMDYKPVIVLLKHKVIAIDNLIGRVKYYEFTDHCPEKIEEYCRAYPLEYGELDGCYFGGQWWIYDVNPTPGDAAFVRMPQEQSIEYQKQYKHHLYEWLS